MSMLFRIVNNPRSFRPHDVIIAYFTIGYKHSRQFRATFKEYVGPAGAFEQRITVLNNALSDSDLPERKCERQNNARILLVIILPRYMVTITTLASRDF